MNPKPSTSSWTRVEIVSLPNATAIIWHTGKDYRAQLLIDHEACKRLKIANPSVILSDPASNIEEAKGKAERAAVILTTMKEGVS